MYDFYHVRVWCIDSVCGGPFNSYDFFAAWGRGEGESLSIHVVSTQYAGGLKVGPDLLHLEGKIKEGK